MALADFKYFLKGVCKKTVSTPVGSIKLAEINGEIFREIINKAITAKNKVPKRCDHLMIGLMKNRRPVDAFRADCVQKSCLFQWDLSREQKMS